MLLLRDSSLSHQNVTIQNPLHIIEFGNFFCILGYEESQSEQMFRLEKNKFLKVTRPDFGYSRGMISWTLLLYQ